MNYLLDSNTFIEASNRYYSFSICPGYWSWLESTPIKGQVASISMVKDELSNSKDFKNQLDTWMENNPDFFLAINEQDIQMTVGEIAAYAYSIPDLVPGAFENFLGGSEPWLIATAKYYGAKLVTHEQPNPFAKRRILTPNVAKEFGVECIDSFRLLDSLNAHFFYQS